MVNKIRILQCHSHNITITGNNFVRKMQKCSELGASVGFEL